MKVDLSRFRAAPSARLSHLPFESDGTFPSTVVQHPGDHAVPIATVFKRLLNGIFSQTPLVWQTASYLAQCRSVLTQCTAGPALRDIMIPHCLACCSPSHIRCRQVFPSKSFRTTLSSMVSASRRFSFEFSSSRNFRRWVLDTFMPSYLALNL